MNRKFGLLWLVLIVGLAACSPAAEQPAPIIPTNKPEPGTEPTAPAVAETPAGEAVETAIPESNGVISGRTPEGTYFLGAEDAPVTMIDYSDFL
jgi:hypothetical protein